MKTFGRPHATTCPAMTMKSFRKAALIVLNILTITTLSVLIQARASGTDFELSGKPEGGPTITKEGDYEVKTWKDKKKRVVRVQKCLFGALVKETVTDTYWPNGTPYSTQEYSYSSDGSYTQISTYYDEKGDPRHRARMQYDSKYFPKHFAYEKSTWANGEWKPWYVSKYHDDVKQERTPPPETPEGGCAPPAPQTSMVTPGGSGQQLAGFRYTHLTEPLNIISVGGVLGGGNSGYTTTSLLPGSGGTRVVTFDTGIDNPSGPGDIIGTRTVAEPPIPVNSDHGLGNGFNGGGVISVDHFFPGVGDFNGDGTADILWHSTLGVGSSVLLLGGNNDTEVIPEFNLDLLLTFPGNNNQVILNTGIATPLASHFADVCGDVGVRVVHPFSSEFGGFVGVQGIFGGNTSLGEFTFGATWTPGRVDQGPAISVQDERDQYRQQHLRTTNLQQPSLAIPLETR